MDEKHFAESLRAWANGDGDAGDALYAMAYDELKTVARRSLRSYGRGDQLSTTMLVNECYLKLARGGVLGPETQQHFMALCARAMRQIIVDSARRQLSEKRDAAALDEDDFAALRPESAMHLSPEAIASLDQALHDLDRRDPRLARIAECRIFSGMECADIAAVMNVTERTVQREWQRVKALLALVLENRE